VAAESEFVGVSGFAVYGMNFGLTRSLETDEFGQVIDRGPWDGGFWEKGWGTPGVNIVFGQIYPDSEFWTYVRDKMWAPYEPDIPECCH
jgi:hypothetical protein